MTRAAFSQSKRLPASPWIASRTGGPLSFHRPRALSQRSIGVESRRLRVRQPFLDMTEPVNPQLVTPAALAGKPPPAFKSP
jgi:hypothetical protein